MKKFEYKVEMFDCLVEQKLNKFGQEGWELVALFSPGDGYTHCFFKREIIISSWPTGPR